MYKTTSLIILLLAFLNCKAQQDSLTKYNTNIPRNLDESVKTLDIAFTKGAKEKFYQLQEKDIKFINYIVPIGEWVRSDSSRLKIYFKKLDLTQYSEVLYFILLSYHRFLHNESGDVSLDLQIHRAKKDSLKLERLKQCNLQKVLDTIDHVYIPFDLQDSYKQLDQILSDSLINKIRLVNINDPFDLPYPFELGMFLRNSWGLWGCSRLKEYFRQHNIYHPDNISFIIMIGYVFYLKGEELSIENIDQYIKTKLLPPPPPPNESVSNVIETKKSSYEKRHDRKIKRNMKVRNLELDPYSYYELELR